MRLMDETKAVRWAVTLVDEKVGRTADYWDDGWVETLVGRWDVGSAAPWGDSMVVHLAVPLVPYSAAWRVFPTVA